MFPVDDSNVRQQVIRELEIMRDCRQEHLTAFYGAFPLESSEEVMMIMEYMDFGYCPFYLLTTRI